MLLFIGVFRWIIYFCFHKQFATVENDFLHNSLNFKLMMALLIHIDVVSLISLIVGVLSLIIAIILYYKGKKIKSPVYLSRTTRLINRDIDQIDKLEILYDGVKQPALTITKFAFWNKGRETIHSQDLTSKDQLRIEIEDEYSILSCDILTQTKKANDFRTEITEDKKSIIISFDYLDYLDGVVLKIRHTGSDRNDLAMKGSIIGAREIKRYRWNYLPPQKLIESKDFQISFVTIGLITALIGILVSHYNVSTLSRGLQVSILLILGLIFLWLIFTFQRSINSPIPIELEEVYQSDDF